MKTFLKENWFKIIKFILLAYFSWAFLYLLMMGVSETNDFQKKFGSAIIIGFVFYFYYAYKARKEGASW